MSFPKAKLKRFNEISGKYITFPAVDHENIFRYKNLRSSERGGGLTDIVWATKKLIRPVRVQGLFGVIRKDPLKFWIENEMVHIADMQDDLVSSRILWIWGC